MSEEKAKTQVTAHDEQESGLDRRSFLRKAGTAGAAAVAGAAAATVPAPVILAQGKSYQWKMVTTWPPEMPVLQTGAQRFAKRVEELSQGRMKIQVFAGGELVPPLGTLTPCPRAPSTTAIPTSCWSRP